MDIIDAIKTRRSIRKYLIKYHELFSYPYFQNESANSYSYMLEGFDNTWSKWSSESKAVFTNLSEGTYTFRVKARNVYLEESQESSFSFTIFPPWYRTIWAYLGYVIIGLFVLVVTVKLYTRKLEADKKRLEGLVAERTAEVVKQKDEILEKNIEIEHKNKDITDSIVYAKRIQEALLPVKDQINIPTLEIFVYFRPKDIVSGDFYFMRQVPRSNMLVAAAADCTGHGVPGAFMSMLGIAYLKEIVSKDGITQPDIILDKLRREIIRSLKQEGGNQRDGMDIALCTISLDMLELHFAGANNPLYIVGSKQYAVGRGNPDCLLPTANCLLTELKGDKMPIGIHERMDAFTLHTHQLQKGDCIYLFSDGMADQFGGPDCKKFKYKPFKELLLKNSLLKMEEQKTILDKTLSDWMGNFEQIDDILVLGIKI